MIYAVTLIITTWGEGRDYLAAFFTATALYLALEFFLGKLVFIDNRSINLVAAFNPFIRKLKLQLEEITKLTVRSTGFTGVTTLTFETVSKSEERSCLLLGFETKRIINTLTKAGVDVEIIDG